MILTDFAFALALASAAAPAPAADTAPHDCASCADWNAEQTPFRLYGNSYYVGVHGLSSVLIATKAGLLLIDGDLPQSAPVIARHIAALGFRVEDLKWIVNSHPHYDHAGGIAALQRMSGAKVASSRLGAQALRSGTVPGDDPQFGLGEDAMRFPAVAQVTELADGATITLAETALTIHYTPGHTPGGNSWSWRSCEAGRCLDLVYADSLTPVSAPNFRYTGDGGALLPRFGRSIKTVHDLPCDILVSAHPDASGLLDKLAARDKDPANNALIDPDACKTYADAAQQRLDQRIREEQAQPAAAP